MDRLLKSSLFSCTAVEVYIYEMFVFQATTTKTNVSVDKVRLAVLSAMTQFARLIVKEHNKTVSTWEEEVEFSVIKAFPRSGLIEVLVYTSNETYKWVNEGTPEHDIWAGWYTNKSDKKLLSFFVPNTPKTKPGRIESGMSSVGNTHVVTSYVHHPGIKPRNFDSAIAKKMQPLFATMIQEAIVLALVD